MVFRFSFIVGNTNLCIFMLKETAEWRSLIEDEFVLKIVHNIKINDQKKIKEVIDYNKDIIIKHWIKYFGKED